MFLSTESQFNRKEHNRDSQRWEFMQKIFISYSRKDIDFARKLAGDLEKAGYDVWWDITDLQGGDDWVKNIPTAIAESQYVIVVLTPNSVESEWVRKEYTQALSLRKKIVPIMLTPTSVPFALNTINFVNFAVGEYPDNFKKLLSPLGFTGTPPVVEPYKKALLAIPYLKYGIPALIGLILLFAFILTPRNNPPETPTVTPTLTFESSPTASATPEPPTPTNTATATEVITHTPTHTLTASPTVFYKVSLPMCIISDSTNIRVRSGPSGTYGYILLNLEDASGQRIKVCPEFSAKIENEGYTWLLIAPNQEDGTLQPYEGKWIRRDLLENIAIDILPAVTLTATPTPSNTPTVTPSFTPSSTPTITSSPTPTFTLTASTTPSSTPADTDTPEPTDTPSP